MEPINNHFFLKAGLFFLCCTSMVFSQDPFQEASKATFYEVINNIKWRDFTVADKFDTEPICWADFAQRVRNDTKVKITDKWGLRYKDAMSWLERIQDILDSHKFEGVNFPNNQYIKHPKRDHLLSALQNNLFNIDGTSSSQMFVDDFKNGGTVTEEEEKILKDLHYDFKWRRSTRLAIDEQEFLGCKYSVEIIIYLENFDFAKGIINWRVSKFIKFYCDCKLVSNSQKESELKAGFITLISIITSSMDQLNLNHTLFKSSSQPYATWLYMICCDGSENDRYKHLNDGSTPNREEHDEGDKDDHGSYQAPGSEVENCCANSTANYSVGLFPVISLGNNFEDSTIGVGVEGLVKLGNSFANNEWYAGVGSQYLVSSAQNSDIKENFYSGAVIVENRTPILPCLQWTQRLYGQYGMGTYEAFGNQDDFTQTLIELHTGVNLDISNNIAIGLDGAMVSFGNQTFKPDDGEDVKTDIGNFNFGQNRIRLGFRVKF